MSAETQDTVTNPAALDQSAFAQWIGIDPSALADEPEEATTDDTPEATETTPDDADAADAEAVDADAPDADTTDDDATGDAAAPEPDDAEEVPKLPFAATAKDEAVDPALLGAMQVTFKADGKDVTLPLADVVRRAQSEPAVQRKAYALTQEMERAQAQLQQVQEEIAEVRRVAIQMARDPDYYARVVQELEAYDAPEARAQRAEAELAAERKAQQEARARAERESQLAEFATTEIAPTLDRIVGENPLVSQEEILGKFFADTSAITVNGVIPPEYHARVAEYLRTELAAFAASRQQQYAARDAKVKAEQLKTQRERQAMKNTKAAATKPVGQPNGLRDEPAPKKPRNFAEASQGALSALISGLS